MSGRLTTDDALQMVCRLADPKTTPRRRKELSLLLRAHLLALKAEMRDVQQRYTVALYGFTQPFNN